MKVNNRFCSFYYEYDEDVATVDINPSKTALLIIDMQNVFLIRPEIDAQNPKGREIADKWEQFYENIDNIVIPNNKRILKEFRKHNMLVTYAQIMSHLKDGRDRSLCQKSTGFNELLLPKGSYEGKIIKELEPIDNEIIFTKSTDSAVTGTNMSLLLRNCGIDTVVCTGVFTDQCVSGTVRALADESFHVWLIEDACRAATEEIQRHELTVLNNIYCHVINTDELLAAIERGIEDET